MATTITANGINFPDGSASAPSIGGTDTNTGLFTGSDIVGFETGGVERIRIDSSGRLIVGTNSARNTRLGTNNFSGLLQIESDSEAAATIGRFNNGAGSSRLVLQKARGTKASPSVVQSGDDCGQILFSGWDGDTFTNAAYIKVEVDGTPGDDDMPGRLIFATTPDGTTTSQERLRIASDGKIGINTTSPIGTLDVYDGTFILSKPNETGNERNWRFLNNNAAAGNLGLQVSTAAAGSTFSNVIELTKEGNVGLGTTSPSDALEISHASDPAIRLHYGSNSGYSVLSIDSSNNLTLDVDASDAGSNSFCNLRIDGSEKLRINSSGKILLGSTRTYYANEYYDDITINNSGGGGGSTGACGITMLSDSGSWGAVQFGDVHDDDVGYMKYAHNGDFLRFGTAGNTRFRIDADGVKFQGDTATANGLNDYEEGNLTWYLRKSDNTSGGNDNGSIVKYTKVGRLVHISGRIRTDSVSSGSNYVFHLDGSLPFTPSTPGTSVVGHWRSQDQLDSSLTASICWGESNTTIYLYTIDSKSDYSPSANNVPASHQTNLVMTFSFTYQAS